MSNSDKQSESQDETEKTGHSTPRGEMEEFPPTTGDDAQSSAAPQPQPEEVPAKDRTSRRRTAAKNRPSPRYDPRIFETQNAQRAPVAETNTGSPAAKETTGQKASGGGGRENKEPLRLRLDLNLDLDVELRARIHGDVTLALL